jgi:hypothetical protein
VFHACLFRGRLRLQIGFSPDLPAEEEVGLIGLIRQARRQAPGPASLWYPAGKRPPGPPDPAWPSLAGAWT